MTTRTYVKDSFQMWWWCHCGRRENFGVDHRHCPGCGAAQDPSHRYFPPPSKRTPASSRGAGPDVVCRYCSSANDCTHAHCCNCGAALDGAKPVHVRPSIPEHAGESPDDAKRDQRAREQTRRAQIKAHHMPSAIRDRERQRATASQPQPATSSDLTAADMRSIKRVTFDTRVLAIIAAAAVLALITALFMWKRDIDVRVVGHTWERKISIEQYQARHGSEWCSSMPSDAYSVSRHRELHHTDRVPDGQDCRTEPGSCRETCRNVDNGNGSGSTVCTQTCSPPRQVCTTRYRDVPVYQDRCSYTVDRWNHSRWATARGSGTKPEPSWPTTAFDRCTITRLGCEREGPRKQTYTVRLVSSESKSYECDLDQRAWASLTVDAQIHAKVRVLLGSLDCDSLFH